MSNSRYRLVAKIASGGMADVYIGELASKDGFERTVAIKKLRQNLFDDQNFVQMFIDESTALSKLDHPNIVKVFELEKSDDSLSIIMEYVEGTDLRNTIRFLNEKNETLPVSISIYILEQILHGLDFAQQNLNIIHRDLSPSNILLSKHGEVKIADFGIAKGTHRTNRTQTGQLMGKFSYMSPEQAYGKTLDIRSDIFACGLIFYEMLTGEKLFNGDNELETLELVRNAVLVTEQINKIPDNLKQFVLKMLQKNPNDRFPTLQELILEIEKIKNIFTFHETKETLALFIKENLSDFLNQNKALQKTLIIQKTKNSKNVFLFSFLLLLALFLFSDSEKQTPSYISVSAIPWGKVTIENFIQDIETPVINQQINAGKHRLTVTYKGLKIEKDVEIQNGQTLKCKAIFPDLEIKCGL